MQAIHHIPSALGSAAEQIAQRTSTAKRNVPRKKAPCECADCQSSFFTMEEQRIDRYEYAKVLTDAEASTLLCKYLHDIAEDRKYLTQSTERYGDRVLAQWQQLTLQERTSLLQTVEPNIPLRKGLIAELWALGADDTRRRHRQHRFYYLLPYLDIDTLNRNPVALLNLIYTRAVSSPQEWAAFDNEQLRTAWPTGTFAVDFNAGAVIMHGYEYGTWKRWEKPAAHRGDTLGFPRGTLVLEAQATLLNFLKKVVQHLLKDVTQKEPASNIQWQKFIAAGLKAPGESATWSTYVYRPFAAPPRFEVDSLLAMVKMRCEATGDHLWLLQTEPSYFKQYMRGVSQVQVIETSNNKEGSAALLYSQIVYDVKNHWFWCCAVQEFETLQGVYRRFQDSIGPGIPLPPKVERALGALDLMLVNIIDERVKHLQAMIPQRPGFRHIYNHDSSARSSDGEHFIKSKFTKLSKREFVFRTERLWFVLVQLLGHPNEEKRIQYTTLLGLLDDHLAKSNSAERGRLDGVLYEILSEYVMLLELLWTIRTHLPKYATRTMEECAETESGWFWEPAKPNNQMTASLSQSNAIAALRKFQITPPPSGQRNKQWLDQFEAFHGASQHFWRENAAIFQDVHRTSYPSVNFTKDMSILFSFNDKQYTDRLNAKRKQVLANGQKSKIPEGLDVFLPLPKARGEESAKAALSTEVKAKVKTRGEARAAQETEDTTQVEDINNDLSSTHLAAPITVSRRSYGIFCCMFPQKAEERQKSIDWATFVDSMIDAGFVAKNGGGSIVIFENTTRGGRILFHRPHPEPVIDPIMLQSMGNRLNRWFGWERETFEVVKK